MITHSRALATLYALWRNQRVARKDIAAFQNQRLRLLVQHAYANVPYHRRLLDRHGVKPGDIRGVADLPAIPVTSKRDLQLLPKEDVVARGVDTRRLITRRTSGSSGEPFSIHRTSLETRLLRAVRLRAMHDFGLRPADTVASVILARPPHPRDHPFPVSVLRSLGLYRHKLLNCLSPARDILRELRECSPDVVGGFGGVLSQMAQVMSEDDRLAVRPRFVAVGGEVLTPLMRRQIAEAFNAPVFELYTSVECMTIAWECTETGELHTCDDSVIVEVLKDGSPVRPGECGEIVVTSLHSFAMPFLRYRLGDLVTQGAETCRCGRPFGTIRAVQGRMIDYFPLPGGRLIHPYEIVAILLQDAEPWLRAYRLLQDRGDRIVLNALPSVAPTSSQLSRLHTAVAAVLGQGVEFQVRLVSEIAVEESGKFRLARSLLRSNYDGIDWNSQHSL